MKVNPEFLRRHDSAAMAEIVSYLAGVAQATRDELVLVCPHVSGPEHAGQLLEELAMAKRIRKTGRGTFELSRRDIDTRAQDLLIQAADTIDQRAAERDQADGERSMARTVAAFNALTGHRLSETQGWQFMALLKLSRSNGGRLQLDDYVDGAAYVALAGESATKESAP